MYKHNKHNMQYNWRTNTKLQMTRGEGLGR